MEGGEEEGGVCGDGNGVRHKRRVFSWKGRRGGRGFVSLETGHVTNEDSLPGGEEEGGAGWWAWKRGTSQTRTHQLEGRKRKEKSVELGGKGVLKKGGITSGRGG